MDERQNWQLVFLITCLSSGRGIHFNERQLEKADGYIPSSEVSKKCIFLSLFFVYLYADCKGPVSESRDQGLYAGKVISANYCKCDASENNNLTAGGSALGCICVIMSEWFDACVPISVCSHSIGLPVLTI